MDWIFKEDGFVPENIALNGNRFILGNGYVGYRGTMEEYRAAEQVGCVLNGVYDRCGDKWREPVNVPNALWTQVFDNGTLLSAKDAASHGQKLDFRHAIHTRETSFANGVTLSSERFVSMDQIHLVAMKYTVKAEKDIALTLKSGIDKDVWDINGPHLQDAALTREGNTVVYSARTGELGLAVCVAEITDFGAKQESSSDCLREVPLSLKAGEEYSFIRYAVIGTSAELADPAGYVRKTVAEAAAKGYDTLKAEHAAECDRYWESSDVVIEGDAEAQYAMRYSLYHLMILAPRHSGKVSIPARGISGQVYKGAVFWDTEMFMSPFFNLTSPEIARNLILYRVNTLPGARRKAQEFGYRGAFYAWESQETGDDACSFFNVPDVFTGRPMRTYFRDKQIHVSADIILALKKYLCETGDTSILAEGAFEMALECARFFWSYGYYDADRDRFVIVDVTGPDEYHERVANNAYTNRMAKMTLDTALELADVVAKENPALYQAVDEKIHFAADLPNFRKMSEKLTIPQPGADGVIEQFDRYFTLENCTLADVRSRLKDPGEYWGGGNGVAVMTRIIKQADVILLMHLFRDEYTTEQIAANWSYYEPRTEHGSTLSACAYAITAAAIGKADWAYPFFMKTATVDMSGKSKQFIGDLYIGGTHPAANGGTYLSAVFGFAGVRVLADEIRVSPGLPPQWKALEFKLKVRGGVYLLRVEAKRVEVTCVNAAQNGGAFTIFGKSETVAVGKKCVFEEK